MAEFVAGRRNAHLAPLHGAARGQGGDHTGRLDEASVEHALHVALGLAQVAVSTSIGVMRALEQYGPTPVGFAAAGAVVAAGVAQAASIASAAMGRGPGGASSFGGMSGPATSTEALFAPATAGGQSGGPGGEIRVRTSAGGEWLHARDMQSEARRLGLMLRLEGA